MKAIAQKAQLAIEGGTAVRTRPFAPWPHFEPDEIEAVAAVLRSGRINYWTGPEGNTFEREYATYVGRKHGVALANGTLALELALIALGIGPGDEVVVPSRTFVATASCVAVHGGRAICAEVDPDSGNVTAETLRAALTPKTRAIIPVHMSGWPCAMDEIMALARECKLKVIEDCAQAHGATYQGKPVGAFGEAAVFSFCQDKIMTTGGEGGMLLLDDEAAWKRAWSYKDHGKDHDLATAPRSGHSYRLVHTGFGTNWRMTEMQSALGRVLLRKIDARVAQRRRNAAVLDEAFGRIPALRVVKPKSTERCSYYKYYAYVRPEKLAAGWTRERLLDAINAEGVPCSTGGSAEIYMEQAFPPEWKPQQAGKVARYPVARALGETSLMFHVHSTLAEPDMRDVVTAVEKVMSAASA
ncbi:MAG: DegT/DnrJ/EryC1/StrS aminotransferase family protein [Candidatus Koribacter versatilis]|uniref:DegT/DnrJ/EryC1/StrS aminotransferase family protein n=1 Tax=Candidatus Korobacter versatilis TaxID=658062 RepID=A0A932ENV2_9BACT|nr:DegT/DnrJ/EryC1/StrS aminotransferase family protein [Candidatus Koribacter versatilis]